MVSKIGISTDPAAGTASGWVPRHAASKHMQRREWRDAQTAQEQPASTSTQELWRAVLPSSSCSPSMCPSPSPPSARSPTRRRRRSRLRPESRRPRGTPRPWEAAARSPQVPRTPAPRRGSPVFPVRGGPACRRRCCLPPWPAPRRTGARHRPPRLAA